MSFNLYTRLRGIFPQARLLVGTVVAIDSGQVTVELPDGATIAARGSASVGARVYVRDGVIEGAAPALSVIDIEI